ncbi:hypothetical protein, partial [Candidatus Ichthyocystis hellenicum]|uniref:hypothetical protein n=1 Tax=Candidatus Ichthyocystis hellenicum TaxID=1561003 RepID=UPI001585CC68
MVVSNISLVHHDLNYDVDNDSRHQDESSNHVGGHSVNSSSATSVLSMGFTFTATLLFSIVGSGNASQINELVDSNSPSIYMHNFMDRANSFFSVPIEYIIVTTIFSLGLFVVFAIVFIINLYESPDDDQDEVMLEN